MEFELKFYRDVWCAVWYIDGKTQRRSLKTTDRDEGRRRLADFEKRYRTPVTTVTEIVKAYLADKAEGPSRETNKFAWKALEPTFGHLRPDQVTRQTSRDYLTKRREAGISDNTIHRELGVLNAGLRWHDRNTPAIVELPTKPPPKDRYLTRQEFRALLDAAASPHISLFMNLAYRTGARSAAILQLTWDRVDFQRGLINFATGDHGNKRRAVVAMNDKLREALETAKKAAQSDFVIEYAERPVKSIKAAFRRAAERARLADVTPHVLRHTAAVHMAEGGIEMEEISQFLGHSSTKTTEKVYARFSPTYLRRAADILDA